MNNTNWNPYWRKAGDFLYDRSQASVTHTRCLIEIINDERPDWEDWKSAAKWPEPYPSEDLSGLDYY